jgi:polar amino acid transport system substrate-binding protein
MRIASAILIAMMLLAASGCKAEEPPALQPTVAPPLIGTEGVLKAGVDSELPPFAGVDAGQQAGIDIDVAAALAERMGLRVEYVEVKPSEAASALAQGKVDVVLSIPPTDSSLSSLSLAGSYVTDAPALFITTEGTASVEPSLTLEAPLPSPIGVQEGSESFWMLRSEFDSETIKPFKTLREAIDELASGELEMVAGGALVGAYIARDFPMVRLGGQMAPASPLAVAVAAEKSELGDAVRAVLDELAADGVLEAIRLKWVGSLPQLIGPESEGVDTPDA